MPKFLMECSECEKRFQTRKPVARRKCPSCGIVTNFIVVEKKQVKIVREKKPFDILCTYCCAQGHISTGVIPKECPRCHQPFNRHAEAETITDTIYNLLTGSGNRQKGYVRVSLGRDGMPWWKGEKDSFGDSINPFFDREHPHARDIYQGQGEGMRTDDLRPVYTTTTKRRKF